MTEYIYEHKPSGADHMGKPVELPTLVQREEIVRCRDCKYYMDYEHEYEPNLGYCGFHDMQEVRDSRFCAWAERKEDGDD